MTEKQKDALGAVEKINDELYDKYRKKGICRDDIPALSITFSNDMLFISLSIMSEKLDVPDIHLYSSVNDDRIYYEKSDKYETFYKLIKRKFIEIKEEIYSVKL